MSGRSLSFDRAADFYDATRETSSGQIAASIEALTDNLPEDERILEVGIGTGRMGVPLADSGQTLYGIDLSMRMLEKLTEKSSSIPVAQADATLLPFGDNTFGGAYATWLLHLIEDWHRALLEMARVVKNGGTIMATIGGIKGFGAGCSQEIVWDFRSITGVDHNLGASSLDEIDQFMASRGWIGRAVGRFSNVEHVAPAEMLRRLRDNTFSFTWSLDEQVRLAAVKEVEARARERYGDLDVTLPNEFVTEWRAYDLD